MTEQQEDRAPRIADPALRRLHPLTPLLRSWGAVGVITAAALGALGNNADQVTWVWHAVQGDADIPLLLRAAGLLVLVAVILLAAGWVSWRMTGFALVVERRDEADRHPVGTLLYHRGVLVRQRSRVRLDRVQSVDVSQPVIPRLLGLAMVSLDMAAGAGASVKLAYLREAEAWHLRDEILHYTPTGGGAPRDPSRPAKPAREQQLVARISTHRLVQATLLEGVGVYVLLFVVVIAAIGAGIGFGWEVLLGSLTAVFGVVLALFLMLRNQVGTVLRDANFTLLRTSSAIRISSGLLSTVNRTIELDRVQEVRIVEPLTWRWLGWARVEVDVAGARTDGSSPAASLMPVADSEEAVAFVASVLGADLADPRVAGPGQRARWVDPLGHRFLGVTLLDQGGLSRRGRWRRTRFFVPYARVQSVSVRQGWLQRRLGLATVHLDMPAGVRRWTAPHRDATEAHMLVNDLVERARRQRAMPWSEPTLDPGDAGSDDQPQHDAAQQLAPGVEDRPREVRQPRHEEHDHAERRQRDGERGNEPEQHQGQDQPRDRQGR
jgi:putative membrane protein